jgi:hypothetical protein
VHALIVAVGGVLADGRGRVPLVVAAGTGASTISSSAYSCRVHLCPHATDCAADVPAWRCQVRCVNLADSC